MTFHHVFIYLDLVCILYPVCSLRFVLTDLEFTSSFRYQRGGSVLSVLCHIALYSSVFRLVTVFDHFCYCYCVIVDVYALRDNKMATCRSNEYSNYVTK